jgi:hypothetical protein
MSGISPSKRRILKKREREEKKKKEKGRGARIEKQKR